MTDPIQPSRGAAKRAIRRAALAGITVAAAILINGAMMRMKAGADQVSSAREQSVPTVAIVHPIAEPGGNALTLPANLQAWNSAPIYARVPGYLTKWYKDIGAHVKKGEALAEIDTPELDQQIAQAKADLANAQAALELADTTNVRWQKLVAIGAVAKQEADQKAGDLAVKVAAVNSSKANLDRLMATREFAHIASPFDGVVTQRATDIGALVNAGAGSSGSLLFNVADLHKIRVYVQVPQNYSADIHSGLAAELSLPEYPGEKFAATLVSTSNSIDPQSNTLLIQLEADNASGKLKPGAYAQLSFRLPRATTTVTVPATALLFRGDGLRVATVQPGNRVALKAVTVAEDLGNSVHISAGLAPSDQVIDNPPDSITDGDVVRIAAALRRAANN